VERTAHRQASAGVCAKGAERVRETKYWKKSMIDTIQLIIAVLVAVFFAIFITKDHPRI